MMLNGKIAIVYGGGLIGGIVARAQQVASAAVSAPLDRAGATTGTIVNLTCCSIMNAN